MEQTAAYTVRIENFEGPMDLLIHLIEKNKMDVYDIRITEITDQYVDYLRQMEELDLELTSEFLVMASTLLLLKSRMLLPEANKAGDESGDLKDELVNRLIEYKKFKEFAAELKQREADYSKLFYKPHEVFRILPEKKVNASFPPELIPALYKEICERNARKMNPNKRNVEDLVLKDKVTIRSKIREIIKTLIKKTKFRFSELFKGEKRTRINIAVAFMAMLELAKVKRVSLEQKEAFGEITVKKVEKEKRLNAN